MNPEYSGTPATLSGASSGGRPRSQLHLGDLKDQPDHVEEARRYQGASGLDPGDGERDGHHDAVHNERVVAGDRQRGDGAECQLREDADGKGERAGLESGESEQLGEHASTLGGRVGGGYRPPGDSVRWSWHRRRISDLTVGARRRGCPASRRWAAGTSSCSGRLQAAPMG